MRRIIGSLAISGLVGACFTSAVVLAQVGGAAPAQAPAAAKAKKAAGKADAGADPRSAVNQEDGNEAAKHYRAARKAGQMLIDAAQRQAVEKGVAVKAAIIKRQPAQANRAPLIQQFTNQARPLLRAELLFARHVCQLSRDELRKVNRAAQEMLDEVVAKLVDAQFQPRARVVVQGRLPQSLDSQQLLHDGVISVMKKNLSAEQWSRYEAEMQTREENRKRATICYLVDAIDRELYLSREQCERLEASLTEHWDGGWALYLENHLFGNKYYPMAIDPLVTPLLSDAQRKVWGGVAKVGVYWGFAGMLAGFANDADGLEVELGEPARPQEPNARMGVMMKMQVPVPAIHGVIIEAREPVRDAPVKAAAKKKAAAAGPTVKQLKPAAVDGQKKAGETKD
jgi:hypothetical protein